MERYAAPLRRQRARHASAPSHLRHRREQHSLYAGLARPLCIRRHDRAFRRFRERRTLARPHAHGAGVTIIQRSKTYVVSLKEAQSVYAVYSEGIPFDDCDLLATSLPYPVLQRSYQLSTARGREVDKALLQGLEKSGFRLWYGEDETGFQMMYLRRGGGYYFNVGCSELIMSGQVKLLQFADIERFVAEGARLRDGSVVPAELLVLATGYKNQQDTARAFLGDEIADKIGPVWGFDDGGELRNMWRRTAQPGLWFTAGSLAQCRIFSRYLALQIKAMEEGLLN
jgi:putative flavoprotein involved in K+ transport